MGYLSMTMNDRKTIWLLCTLFCLLLSACGQQECDFCGQNKFCKEFDVMGTTRYICRDCLNDPSLAVSGNVARSYAELYENGTLEYPVESPLRPVEEPEEEVEDDGIPRPDLEMIMNGYDAEADIRQRLLAEQAEKMQEAGLSELPSDTVPEPDYISEPKERTELTELTMEEIISAINTSLQSDSLFLVPTDGTGSEYILYTGNTDLGIHLKPSADPSSRRLVIEQYEGASSSDYVKAIIRSILPYINSSDYDGLGHEIYNNTIRIGSYSYLNVNFSTLSHSADEIEKGRPASEFIIQP